MAAARTSSRSAAFNYSEDLILAHNQQLFTVDLNLRAAVLPKQDAIACVDIQGLAAELPPKPHI